MNEEKGVGDLVWAKMKGHPSWPAMIVNPPRNVSPIPSKKYVLFFGDCDCAWMSEKQLMSFDENFEKYSKIKKLKFQIALKAVEKFRTFFIKLEEGSQNKKADLEVRKKMLRRYSNVSRKEMEQISLMKKKIKKESDAIEKEERLITFTHLGIPNDDVANKVVKKEKIAVTSSEPDVSRSNFESPQHPPPHNENISQNSTDQQLPSHCVSNEVSQKDATMTDSKEVFLPAGDGPSTSRETFGIEFQNEDFLPETCDDHDVPNACISNEIVHENVMETDLKEFLPAGDGPSTSRETFGKDYHNAQRRFMEKLDLRTTASNKKATPKISSHPIYVPVQSIKLISSCKKGKKSKEKSNRASLLKGQNKTVFQAKSPVGKTKNKTVFQAKSPVGKTKEARRFVPIGSPVVPPEIREARHFVPIDSSEVPAEIKNLVRARIQRTVPMNVNFAGVFDLTTLFTEHMATEGDPTELRIIPEITPEIVIEAQELAKKKKTTPMYENLFEIDSPLCYPIVLQRIIEKRAGQVCSSEELWRGIKKPFKLKVGFVGIGSMGSCIVKALLKFGHYVTIWNRSPKKPKCAETIKNGAKWAESPAEVVSKSDVIFCCAADSDASYEIFYGDNGILCGFTASTDVKSYVELSTIEPNLSKKISEEIENLGSRYLEAPILGVSCYHEHRLFLITAGSEHVKQELLDCLCCTGARVYHVGDSVGDALKFKDIYMSVVTGIFLPLAESVGLLKAIGFDPHLLMDVLEETNLNCSVIRNKLTDILEGRWNNGISINEALKSFRHLREYDPNQQFRVAAAAHESLKIAKKQEYGQQDIVSVFKLL